MSRTKKPKLPRFCQNCKNECGWKRTQFHNVFKCNHCQILVKVESGSVTVQRYA